LTLGGGRDGGHVRRHPYAPARQLAGEIGYDLTRGVYDEADKVGWSTLDTRDNAAPQLVARRTVVVALLQLLFSAQSDLPVPLHMPR
jgi:hypothetical protein